MTINFEDEAKLDFDFDLKETAEKVIEAALDHIGLKYEVTLSLLVTDENTIKSINAKNRQIDNVTDVLSFPAMEFDVPGDFSKADNDPLLFDPESGELILGDVVINAARVRSQAADFGHSELREYSFLLVHSILHLSGYDHETEEEEEVMTSLQKDILNELGIMR